MDRKLKAVLELPFITIMAVMIAIFCRLEEVLSRAWEEAKSDTFEPKNNDLRRFFSVNQKLWEFLPPRPKIPGLTAA